MADPKNDDSDFALPILPPRKAVSAVPNFSSEPPTPAEPVVPDAPALDIQPADSTAAGYFVLNRNKGLQGYTLGTSAPPDPEEQNKLRQEFERAERRRAPDYSAGGGTDTFSIIETVREHSLPEQDDVATYVSSATTFIQDAKKAGKISNESIPQLLDLIKTGAELCTHTFTKYTPGRFDFDAIDKLTSLKEQYAVLDKKLNGRDAKLVNKVFSGDMATLAEAFYKDVLSFLPDHQLPKGPIATFTLSRALDKAQTACLMEIGAPLPQIVNEMTEIQVFEAVVREAKESRISGTPKEKPKQKTTPLKSKAPDAEDDAPPATKISTLELQANKLCEWMHLELPKKQKNRAIEVIRSVVKDNLSDRFGYNQYNDTDLLVDAIESKYSKAVDQFGFFLKALKAVKGNEQTKNPFHNYEVAESAKDERVGGMQTQLMSDYERARTERAELLAAKRTREKIYGKIIPTASDEDKTEAVEAIRDIVNHGIALAELKGDIVPFFEAGIAHENHMKIAARLDLYEKKLPSALWSLIKPIKENQMLKKRMSPETAHVVDDFIHHRSESEGYQLGR